MALPLTFKTPGVYIDEINAFPNSVVAVETAVPAFIGYTERNTFKGQSLDKTPVRIDSFMEFELYYGKGAHTTYTLENIDLAKSDAPDPDLRIGDAAYVLKADEKSPRFNLYDSMKFFYQNGGGSCFIVSVGLYEEKDPKPFTSIKPFQDGIKLLEKETVPTMLVIPDAVLLEKDNCYTLQQEMLNHCGDQMNRVAILDIYDGDKENGVIYKPIDNFRNQVVSESLDYGAVYYPWLNTTIVQASDVSFKNLNEEAIGILKDLCSTYANKELNPAQSQALADYIAELSGVPANDDFTALETTYKGALKAWKEATEADKDQKKTDLATALKALQDKKAEILMPYKEAAANPEAKKNAKGAVEAANKKVSAAADAAAKTAAEGELKAAKEELKIAEGLIASKTINGVLNIAIPDYKLIMEAVLKKKNLMPPSAAMAGVYSLVDAQRGVWKAPANVSVSGVVSPAVLIDYEGQQDLNAPISGKAICAIRPFIGLGTMVWGARTLDANNMDYRYINVRRTMIMMEQSIKFAAKAYVFEPNVKNTWVTVQAMISNFLTNLWKLGALAGTVPADAFNVNVGLGTTMTANDILEGIMRIEVKVAVSRPAEFIVISFEQQMQKS